MLMCAECAECAVGADDAACVRGVRPGKSDRSWGGLQLIRIGSPSPGNMVKMGLHGEEFL